MQTVNIQGNEEYQRDVIRNFTKKVREKRFLVPEDFDKTFEFFCKIVEAECKSYNIECGYNRKNNKLELIKQEVADSMPENEWLGMEVASCDYSDELGEDVTFSFDPVFYCKKYFGKEKLEDRLEGIVELLFSAYHEVDHSVKLVNFGRSYLSPETLETARELFLREVYGEEFYRDNYSILSFERYADEYAYGTTLEMVTESDVLEIAENKISKKRLDRDDVPFAELGKLKFYDKMHVKRDLLFRLSLLEMRNNPKFLYMYPIFGKQYKNDGTQKNIHELFETMNEDFRKIIHRHTSLDSLHELTPALQKEYFDCQTFYYELILPQVALSTDRDYNILAEKYGVTFLQNFLSGMEKYFNIRAQNRLKYTETYRGEMFESADEIKRDLTKSVNSVVRFRNGACLNKIAEELLRTGGFVRGTREIMTPELVKRREVFANSLIGVYDAIESEDEYKQRAENEKMDIDEVINALYYNRFENFLKNVEINKQEEQEFGRAEVVRTVQILKIVKLFTKETGKNYFIEFLKIPDVNRLMTVFEKDKNGYLKDSILRAQLRIKSVVYPFTEAEDGKYRNYMLGMEETEEGLDIKKKIEMLDDEMEANKPRRNVGIGRN